MKQWEYVSLVLSWSKGQKRVTVTQYGETKHISLDTGKNRFGNSHVDKFNKIIGKLGSAGWEIVSICPIQGVSYHSFLLSNDGNFIADQQAQEFWLKRELTDEKAQPIEKTLMYIFKDHKVSSPAKDDEQFEYYNS
ncbi:MULTISPECIES: hypothetical protein [Salinimonas]|uniref:DUF4177 domain-containing protein n=2 Tax=Salinimonas TaxID=288793 RepID=A0A5B7YJE3_9ALTE|nr:MULTISPECIES: hypothetical protein [Salinimonas]MBD3587656.1 hypothetical protein [Salinimonas profundi]QCZ95433.1 hypothetical protein FBQ74_18020 [Salinimonas iocasae]